MTAAPEYEAYLFEQWTHGTFDDYWAQPGLYAAGYYAQSADVPQVHMSSWYDPYVRTATENYQGLVTRKRGPVRLILGPWTHGNRSYQLCRGCRFWPGGNAGRQPRPRLLHPALTLVRPLVTRRGQWCRDGTGGAGLRHGGWQWTPQCRWPSRAWRALAPGCHVAVTRDAVHPLLFAYEWGTVARHARRCGTATDVSLRSDPSGAHHRRSDLLG